MKFLSLIVLFLFSVFSNAQNFKVNLLENYVIWDKANHNAFTSLESFNGYLYCAFREGKSHKSYDGKIRIIRSIDGVNWESVASIKSKKEDLRDPKLILNQEKLYLLMVSRTKTKHFSYTYSTANGTKWSFLGRSVDTWRWSASKNKRALYSIGYSGKDKAGSLYRTENGQEWNSLKNNFFPDASSMPNETKLFFTDDDRMVALVRQERGSKNAMLGVSSPPYSVWNWKDLGVRLGSPAGIVLNDNKLLTCVRLYDYPIRLSFVMINIKQASYKEIFSIPTAGGDTGYADIVKHNGAYFLSYYSSKNRAKRATIYLAKINIESNE